MSDPAHDAAGAGAGLAEIFAPPVAAAINHLLRSASWACERLKPFCGKTARFSLAPFAVTLTINASGEVEATTSGPRDTLAERRVAGTGAEARYPQTAGCASNESARPTDATFTLTPGVALRMLASDQNAWQDVQTSGDTELAREILFVAQNLRWDAEEDLSRVFGDIVAHRMVQAAGDLKHWQQQATDSIARSAAAYWTDEQPLIATRHDVGRFVREVDALRDDVARAEKRIERLAAGTIRGC
jgi:ubiquinone biosynthesis protein UbiJ